MSIIATKLTYNYTKASFDKYLFLNAFEKEIFLKSV